MQYVSKPSNLEKGSRGQSSSETSSYPCLASSGSQWRPATSQPTSWREATGWNPKLLPFRPRNYRSSCWEVQEKQARCPRPGWLRAGDRAWVRMDSGNRLEPERLPSRIPTGTAFMSLKQPARLNLGGSHFTQFLGQREESRYRRRPPPPPQRHQCTTAL